MSSADLTAEQREAVIDGRVHDCPYNHPAGTRCPNCAKWPFTKGGAAEFVAAMRAEIEADERESDAKHQALDIASIT